MFRDIRFGIMCASAVLAAACLVSPTLGDDLVAAPDVAAILEFSRIAPEQVLLEEDFEAADCATLAQSYAGSLPNKVQFLDVTDEQAFSGKRSFKIELIFEPGRHGNAYFSLPVEIPIWSEVKVKMYVKSSFQPDVKVTLYHGINWGDLEEGVSGNVTQGAKTGEENGWQCWEATAKNNGGVGEYMSAAAIMFQLNGDHPQTKVTFYVDKITITAKLQPSWKQMWADTRNYYTVHYEKEKRETASRRLGNLKEWYAECDRNLKSLSLPKTASPLVAEQFNALVSKIKEDLSTAQPMIEQIEKGLQDKNTRFTEDINKPERIVSPARHYVNIASAYPTYAAKYSDSDIITYALDLTQSYPTLPTGPMAHNEELTYYDWSQQGVGIENPQILPDTKPVPAKPGRVLKGFGCRGVYVPLSFAIHTAKGLEKLEFTASDLKSAKGMIPASNVDLRVVAGWYRPFNEKWRYMNELLLHDPEFAVPVHAEKRNSYRDPLYGSDAGKLLPVTIPAGENRQFYVTIRIPNKAKAGIYKGTITGKNLDGKSVSWNVHLEVLPFDLDPTPYAYSAFYTTYLRDEEFKQKQGIHSWFKSPAQMEAELKNQSEHGLNTLMLYDGGIKKTDSGWDFSQLDTCLAMAKRTGLTRSPFVWLGHSVPFRTDPRFGINTVEDMVAAINEQVTAVNKFCKSKGYPQPAFFGHDEATGEALMALKKSYEACNKAGGIVTVACYPNYFAEIGGSLTLPIVFGGTQTLMGQRNIQESHKLGHQCWIYNCPATNMPASPSVFRRRYGLAMWRNNEQGATPWEYSGLNYSREQGPGYGADRPVVRQYAFAYPTWNGKPIDTVTYEAYREGIYDTRYLATLEKYLKKAKSSGATPKLTAEIDAWMKDFSVHDDLQQVRRQMADYTARLISAIAKDGKKR